MNRITENIQELEIQCPLSSRKSGHFFIRDIALTLSDSRLLVFLPGMI